MLPLVLTEEGDQGKPCCTDEMDAGQTGRSKQLGFKTVCDTHLVHQLLYSHQVAIKIIPSICL